LRDHVADGPIPGSDPVTFRQIVLAVPFAVKRPYPERGAGGEDHIREVDAHRRDLTRTPVTAPRSFSCADRGSSNGQPAA
jgi:hypothetical protein